MAESSKKSVFIVRPFGEKDGIDFDEVEKKLIMPALNASKHNFDGGSAQRIVESRDIREDLFEELLKADLVIADLSIHSANVFYELGVRHAFRKMHTVLIRCDKDEIPFDLQLLRYLKYDAANPASQVHALAEAINRTLETKHVDSPAYRVLPLLDEPERFRLEVVPPSFLEDVNRAIHRNRIGDLSLYHDELKRLGWEDAGQRLIGEFFFKQGRYALAERAWERVLDLADDEQKAFDARDRLSTVYQRLEKLGDSDFMLKMLLDNEKLTSAPRSQAWGLSGRNDKERWVQAWRSAPADRRRNAALESAFLESSYDKYRKAFEFDLNNYWAGQNALTLTLIQAELAEALPEVWEACCIDEKAAAKRLLEKRKERDLLEKLVTASLHSAAIRTPKEDIWLQVTKADMHLLTGDKPERTQKLYRDVVAQSAGIVLDSAVRQIRMLDDLGIRTEHTRAALDELPPLPKKEMVHVVLFTGHMIDKANRTEPRFPGTDEHIRAAREGIERELWQTIRLVEESASREASVNVIGIAGGACGGDLLFHDVCERIGIQTRLYLPFGREEFLRASVQHAGHYWVDLFNGVFLNRDPQRVFKLQSEKALPDWLRSRGGYSVWERNNQWMLHHAFAEGDAVTLIALWDGAGQDGEGGTKDMINQAQARGARVRIIDTKELFGL